MMLWRVYMGRHRRPEGLGDGYWPQAPLLTNSMLGDGWIEWLGPTSWRVRYDLVVPAGQRRRAWDRV